MADKLQRIQEILKSNIILHQILMTNTETLSVVESVAEQCIEVLSRDKKLLICGNGGSAADAQHMAAELVGRFQRERKGLAAIALNTDTSVLTAWANDYEYESVFERQVQALGRTGDVLIGISTSGNSSNILRAFEYAKSNGMVTVGLLGKDGGSIKHISDYAIIVPDQCTARIQEVHITMIHILCELIEEAMLGADYGQ